jgi:hypothetical protein
MKNKIIFLPILMLLLSCKFFTNQEKKLDYIAQKVVSESSKSWQNTINKNLQYHANGEDFGTKDMIGIDLYTLVSPLAENNLETMVKFVAHNRIDIAQLVGVGLIDFIKGKGEFDIEKFVNSKAMRNFVPGKLVGSNNIKDYMGFLIGISRGKISPNLLVVMYYDYNFNAKSPASWSTTLDAVAKLYQNNKILAIAPLSEKTKQQNMFLQQMNLSLGQNPLPFAQVLNMIGDSNVLKSVNGLKYLIDPVGESVSFFDKQNVSSKLVSYYPFKGSLVINSTTSDCQKITKVDMKPAYQDVKNLLYPSR